MAGQMGLYVSWTLIVIVNQQYRSSSRVACEISDFHATTHDLAGGPPFDLQPRSSGLYRPTHLQLHPRHGSTCRQWPDVREGRL